MHWNFLFVDIKKNIFPVLEKNKTNKNQHYILSII